MATKRAGASADRRAKPAKTETRQNTPKKHALTPAMEARKWVPGQSGNPGGRPKRDKAADIAQAIFEGHGEAIMRAMLKKLRKGDARAFTALADRGYGKAHQQIDVNANMAVTLVVDL